MTASEQLLEFPLEIIYDPVEALLEPGLYGLVHIAYHLAEAVCGFPYVLPLTHQEIISLPDSLIFLDGAYIDFSQLTQPVLYLSVLFYGRRHDKLVALELNSLHI